MPRVTVDGGLIVLLPGTGVEIDGAGDAPDDPGPVLRLTHELPAAVRAWVAEVMADPALAPRAGPHQETTAPAFRGTGRA